MSHSKSYTLKKGFLEYGTQTFPYFLLVYFWNTIFINDFFNSYLYIILNPKNYAKHELPFKFKSNHPVFTDTTIEKYELKPLSRALPIRSIQNGGYSFLFVVHFCGPPS